MLFRQLFDQETWTYTYLIADETTHEAALIDPVLEQVERDLRVVEELGLKLKWVLETHVHADHVTGAGRLRERVGARVAASFLVGNKLFTGDTLLIRACGRTDFQNGDAGQLYDSITRKLFTLPDETEVYPGHDYAGLTMSMLGEEKRHNPRLAGRSREAFIEFMHNRELAPPKKLDVAVPANRACGKPTLQAQI